MYHVSFKNKGLTPQQHRVSSRKKSILPAVFCSWFVLCDTISTANTFNQQQIFFPHHSANIRVATLLYHRQTGFV